MCESVPLVYYFTYFLGPKLTKAYICVSFAMPRYFYKLKNFFTHLAGEVGGKAGGLVNLSRQKPDLLAIADMPFQATLATGQNRAH